MRYSSTDLPGAYVIDLQRHADERGFFARAFCLDEFRAAGIVVEFVQASISWNVRRGTLRGMHFQWPPSKEGKLVRCTRGSLVDVLLDLRPDQASFGRHVVVQLDAEQRRAVFIPAGVAHGFQTLEDNTEVLYHMTDRYTPALADGVRWNDPAFGISWPISEPILNARDAEYVDFDPDRHRVRHARATMQAFGEGTAA
jgi:dTDP-4-dehydrorhamnose 3,5-epimerase